MIYQLTVVVRSTLKDTQQKKVIEDIKDVFGKAKIKENVWGQKPLAYPIKKEISGYFVSLDIETEEKVPQDLEKKIISNDDILRHLLLKSKTRSTKHETRNK